MNKIKLPPNKMWEEYEDNLKKIIKDKKEINLNTKTTPFKIINNYETKKLQRNKLKDSCNKPRR